MEEGRATEEIVHFFGCLGRCVYLLFAMVCIIGFVTMMTSGVLHGFTHERAWTLLLLAVMFAFLTASEFWERWRTRQWIASRREKRVALEDQIEAARRMLYGDKGRNG